MSSFWDDRAGTTSQVCEASTKSASGVLDFQVLRSVEILTEKRVNLIYLILNEKTQRRFIERFLSVPVPPVSMVMLLPIQGEFRSNRPSKCSETVRLR